MFEKKESISVRKIVFFLCLIGIASIVVFKVYNSSNGVKNTKDNKGNVRGFQDNTDDAKVKVVQSNGVVGEAESIVSGDNLSKTIANSDGKDVKDVNNNVNVEKKIISQENKDDSDNSKGDKNNEKSVLAKEKTVNTNEKNVVDLKVKTDVNNRDEDKNVNETAVIKQKNTANTAVKQLKKANVTKKQDGNNGANNHKNSKNVKIDKIKNKPIISNDHVNVKSMHKSVNVKKNDVANEKGGKNKQQNKQKIAVNIVGFNDRKRNVQSSIDSKSGAKDKKANDGYKKNTQLVNNAIKSEVKTDVNKSLGNKNDKFVIQIGAFKSLESAKLQCSKVVKQLHGNKKCIILTSGDIFRSIIAPFENQESANKFAKELSVAVGIDCLVKHNS